MPCFLCRHIDRNQRHIYADMVQYFCEIHQVPKRFNEHCDSFKPESFVDLVGRLLNDYDFYREKIEYIQDTLNQIENNGTMHDQIPSTYMAGHIIDDPIGYMKAEAEDIRQGLDYNRREIEFLFASMKLWNLK